MKSAAIIAEFNPFHNGHIYLIDTIKNEYDVDFVAVFMSGDFVQRGEPAIFDKYTRAALALDGGADVVFELPAVYATSSAPDFAYGGVLLSNALNCIDYLAFGSECGDIESLKATAELLNNEPDDFKAMLINGQKDGKSYALALSDALEAYCGSSVLKSPNNILGVEYIKSLLKLNSKLSPITITRYGVSHDSVETFTDPSNGHTYESASLIRKKIHESADKNKDFPMFYEDFALPLFSSLRSISKENLSRVLGADADMANRILSASLTSSSLSELIENSAHKQITRASISRVLIHLLLDIFEQDKSEPSYVRLLAMKKSVSPFMKQAQRNSAIPIVTKAADFGIYDNQLFMKDLFAADLYSRARSLKYNIPFTPDIKKPPIIQ